MRRHNRQSGADDEAQVEMTPLLDIVFILLIFFIVTTSFVKESGIEVNRPQSKTAVSQPTANIYVGITEDGDIWIDKREVDIRSVRAIVEQLHSANPEGSVIVQADGNTPTNTLVRLMDQVRLAGIDEIALATKTESEVN